MKKYLFFDNASTTRCCEESTALLQRFSSEDFGNPSSTHAYGQVASRAIREARLFFARTFKVDPEQVIFTGSGSEADNLAIYGTVLELIAKRKDKSSAPLRVLASAIDHPAVRKTVQSLSTLGVDVQLIPVDSQGQIDRTKFLELLTPDTALVSIHQVNNIVGSVLPVEELAALAKERVPGLLFHTDAVQALGKVKVPTAPSSIDFVAISSHKVEGPKGIGALIALNKKSVSNLRPLIWGGEQEGGLRSGTQSAGLIAGFHAAAAQTLQNQETNLAHVRALRDRFRELLRQKNLLDSPDSPLRWNSPKDAVPNIVNLSVPGYPSGPLAKLLEERGCLVSTGSACSSQKMEPDAVLAAMGLPAAVQISAIRISFSRTNTLEEVETLATALDESVRLMKTLLGGRPAR